MATTSVDAQTSERTSVRAIVTVCCPHSSSGGIRWTYDILRGWGRPLIARTIFRRLFFLQFFPPFRAASGLVLPGRREFTKPANLWLYMDRNSAVWWTRRQYQASVLLGDPRNERAKTLLMFLSSNKEAVSAAVYLLCI
jgi:hypothetical protein